MLRLDHLLAYLRQNFNLDQLVKPGPDVLNPYADRIQVHFH